MANQYNVTNLQDLTNRPVVSAAAILRSDHQGHRGDVEQRIDALNDFMSAQAQFQLGASAPSQVFAGSWWANAIASGRTRWQGSTDGLTFAQSFMTVSESWRYSYPTAATSGAFGLQGVWYENSSLGTGVAPFFSTTIPANLVNTVGEGLALVMALSSAASGTVIEWRLPNGSIAQVSGSNQARAAVVKGMALRTGTATAKLFTHVLHAEDNIGRTALTAYGNPTGTWTSNIATDALTSSPSDIGAVAALAHIG